MIKQKINQIIRKILNSEFNRNVLTLVTGTIIARAIPFIITPFLLRLYTPEDFGSYALILSFVGILSVTVTARYDLAIMLPKSEKTAQSILFLTFFLVVVMTTIIFVTILVFDDFLNSYFKLEIYLLIPALVLLSGFYQPLKIFLNRKKAYKSMAVNNMEQSSTIGFAQLIFGWFNYNFYGLILGQLSGQIVSVTRFFIYSKRLSNLSLSKVVFLRALASFKKYFYLLKFGLPALLTSRAAAESMIILVGYFMSMGMAGYVSVLNRVVSIPSSILSSNMEDVFYQKITETKKNKSFPLVKSFFLKLLVFSIPIFLIFYLILKYTFILYFGEDWAEALKYMPYLLIVATFSFIFSPISILFHYYEAQGWNLIWQSIWLISNILIFFIYKFFSLTINEFFLVYSLKQSLLYIIGIYSFIRYAKKIYKV